MASVFSISTSILAVWFISSKVSVSFSSFTMIMLFSSTAVMKSLGLEAKRLFTVSCALMSFSSFVSTM